MAPKDHVIAGITSIFKKGPSNCRTNSFITAMTAVLIIKVGFYKSLGEPTRYIPEGFLHWKCFPKLQVVYSKNSRKETEYYNLSEFV